MKRVYPLLLLALAGCFSRSPQWPRFHIQKKSAEITPLTDEVTDLSRFKAKGLPDPATRKDAPIRADDDSAQSDPTPPELRLPPAATAECRDGTLNYSERRQGACSGHGGVARWL